MKWFAKYFPVILAFFSFLLSVYLWFNGQRPEGQFVGIWVPSILAFGIYLHLINRRDD